MKQEALIETLQQLGFTQYEAQCYLGLLMRHPLNGSQLSAVCGVPRSMVYQALNRLEERAAVVRLSDDDHGPQRYVPVAPHIVLTHLSAQFQATCEEVERELDALVRTPPAEVVLNILGIAEILERAAILIRQAQHRLSVMGGSAELDALKPALAATEARDLSTRLVSIGAAPASHGQVAAFLGENVSAPTRFLLVVADTSAVLLATFPPDTPATGVYSENPILARVLTAFLNTEYYLVRVSNSHPELIGELLDQVLEPEDRERYAHVLRFLGQLATE
jgi:sugar-specific transcriptional regulator TrmB